MSSNLKVNSLVPATGTAIGIGTTGGTIDFRCPATFGGNVTIGGTLTYDEVINIDSIGIVTARSGIDITGGNLNVPSGNLVIGNAGTDGVLRIRGAANSTQVSISDNTSATLRIKTATGALGQIFVESGQSLVLGTDNTERLRITSGGLLKVNSTDSGSYHTIRLNTTTNNAIKDVLHVHSSVDGATAAAGYGVRLNFSGEQSNGNEYTFGGIAGLFSSTGATYGDLAFYTNNNGTNGERLRITSTGYVGINETNPSTHLHVEQDNAHASTYYLNTDAALLVQNKNSTSTSKTVIKLEGPNSSPSDCAIVYGAGSSSLIFADRQNERLRIDSTGRMTQNGTTSADTASALTLKNGVSGNDHTILELISDPNQYSMIYLGASDDRYKGQIRYKDNDHFMDFRTNGTDRMRINSSGQVTIGTNFSQTSRLLYVETTHSSGGEVAYFGNSDSGNYGGLLISAGEINRECRLESAWGESFFTFWTQHGSAGERLRITSTGDVTTCGTSSFSRNNAGVTMRNGDSLSVTRNGGCPFEVNRGSNDGALVHWFQANSHEGTISVSGSSVSYGGGVLTRWSQLVGISTNVKSDRPTIYQGTVMSNLDEMCEWTDEDNMQLNKTQVSTASGDKNVAGVFWGWDDDDDVYTNDFYVAQTGDFIVRVGAATTVTRGDLLESAGDGTAKPQSDDIVRSKTVGKITSGIAYTTYADGTKAYPCVLMAC